MPANKGNLRRRRTIQTSIIEGVDNESASNQVFPHCVLPKLSLDRSDIKSGGQRQRTLLSVSTWDGRSIFEVGVPDHN